MERSHLGALTKGRGLAEQLPSYCSEFSIGEGLARWPLSEHAWPSFVGVDYGRLKCHQSSLLRHSLAIIGAMSLQIGC
jgi:hypothetical protein